MEELSHSTHITPSECDSEETLVASERSGHSARVALPIPESAKDDREETPEDEAEDAGETDFLEDFPDETEELELIHLRISSLVNLRLARFADSLRKLCLRQNSVKRLDPEVFGLLTKLEELDLYDNGVKTVGDALNNLSNLSVLDLSFNLLRAVPETLQYLKSLKTIYLVQNRIYKITGFESVTSLRSLELGGNKIRKIENLDALVNLEELWLGKNKITKLENLGCLKRLKILALQSNRVTKLEGLAELEDLLELYLSHNGIKIMEGLEGNVKLKTLDLGNNFISTLENVAHLTSLEELWMNGNQIPDLQSLEPQLGAISTLETLYLEANPCQTNDGAYRRKIIMYLPQLKQVDATFVKVS